MLEIEDNEDDECGPDCTNICDIIYYDLCFQCKNESECHKTHVDHFKMLDCVMAYITTNEKFNTNLRKGE